MVIPPQKNSLNDTNLCPKCGKANAKDHVFCEFCGTKLTEIIQESGDEQTPKGRKKIIGGILIAALIIGSVVGSHFLFSTSDSDSKGEYIDEEMVAADFLELTSDEIINILGDPDDNTGIGGSPGFYYEDPAMVINFKGMQEDDLSFMVFPSDIPLYDGIPSNLTYPELQELAERKKIDLEDPVFYEGEPDTLMEEDVFAVLFNYEGYRFSYSWYDSDPDVEICSQCYITDDMDMNYY